MLIYKKKLSYFYENNRKKNIKQEVWQVFDRGKAKSGDSAIYPFFSSFNLLGQLLIFVKTNIIGIILTLPP